MIVTSQRGLRTGHQMLADIIYHAQEVQSSLSMRIKTIWLLGMLILLPVRISRLPLHLELMDFWILMGLPIIWLLFILERQTIRLPYIVPMWLILVGSLVSTFASPNLSNSLIVIVKETYLFVLFITVAALLSTLSSRDLRRILVVWSGMVILHGVLIIAQFLSPEIWRITTRLAGGTEIFNNYRAAGLFVDPDKAGSANKAAFFQVLGYVPLLLARPSKKVATILGILLFSSILATGSMGAITAFIFGLVTAVIAITVLSKQHKLFITKFFAQLAIATSLLGVTYFAISQSQGHQDHLESIVFGRAERSSEGRFEAWQRGIDVLLESNIPIWGIGPENFRVVDAMHGKQIHNDLLSFAVERGLLGALGLALFGVTVVSKAIYLLLIYSKHPERPPLEAIIFLAAIGAVLFESLTHQVFHSNHLWLVLAAQEAILFRAAAQNSTPMGVLPLRRLAG